MRKKCKDEGWYESSDSRNGYAVCFLKGYMYNVRFKQASHGYFQVNDEYHPIGALPLEIEKDQLEPISGEPVPGNSFLDSRSDIPRPISVTFDGKNAPDNSSTAYKLYKLI